MSYGREWDPYRRHDAWADAPEAEPRKPEPRAPGKRTLTESLPPRREPDGAELIERATRGGGGVPYRAEMEVAFAEDFGAVRAGVGRGAEMVALGARAAAHGESVAFADRSPSREVVAHELAHVVQARHAAGRTAGVSRASDAAEHEADRLAPLAAAGRRVSVSAPPSAAVHRVSDKELSQLIESADGDTAVQKELHRRFQAYLEESKLQPEAVAREDVERMFSGWVSQLRKAPGPARSDNNNDPLEQAIQGLASLGVKVAPGSPEEGILRAWAAAGELAAFKTPQDLLTALTQEHQAYLADAKQFDAGLQVQVIKEEGLNLVTLGMESFPGDSPEGKALLRHFRVWVARNGFDPETPEDVAKEKLEKGKQALADKGVDLKVSSGSNTNGPAAELIAKLIELLPPKTFDGSHIKYLTLNEPKSGKNPAEFRTGEMRLYVYSILMTQRREVFLRAVTHEFGHVFFQQMVYASRKAPDMAAAYGEIERSDAFLGVDMGSICDAKGRREYQKGRVTGWHEFAAESFMLYLLEGDLLREHIAALADKKREAHEAWKTVYALLQAICDGPYDPTEVRKLLGLA